MSVNGTIRIPPGSKRVASTTADDLFSAARDIAASVADPRIGRAERVARIGVAARQARDITAAVALLDPYGPRSDNSLVRDQLALAGHRAWGYGVDLDDAAERVALSREHGKARDQLRAWADLGGLIETVTPTVAAPIQANPAAWLNGYALPGPAEMGPATEVPGAWDSIPESSIDPEPGDNIELGGGILDGERLPWTLSASALDESMQLVGWSPEAAREIENRLTIIVDVGLESALITKLTDGLTPVADLAAAEAAVGASGFPADLVLANPTDAPAVNRLYAAENLWPAPLTILPTAGVAAGNAVVLASPGIYLEATSVALMVADRPRELGKDVAALRYGRASLRIAGAVQLLGLAVTP